MADAAAVGAAVLDKEKEIGELLDKVKALVKFGLELADQAAHTFDVCSKHGAKEQGIGFTCGEDGGVELYTLPNDYYAHRCVMREKPADTLSVPFECRVFNIAGARNFLQQCVPFCQEHVDKLKHPEGILREVMDDIVDVHAFLALIDDGPLPLKLAAIEAAHELTQAQRKMRMFAFDLDSGHYKRGESIWSAEPLRKRAKPEPQPKATDETAVDRWLDS